MMGLRGCTAWISVILMVVFAHGEPDPKPVQVDYYGIPASQYPSEVYRYDPRAYNYGRYPQAVLAHYNPLSNQGGGYYLTSPYQGGYVAPEYAVNDPNVPRGYDYDGRGGYVNRPLVRVRPLIYNNIDYPAKTYPANTYSNTYSGNNYQRKQTDGVVSTPYYHSSYNGLVRRAGIGEDGRDHQGEQGSYAIRGGVFPSTEYDAADNKGGYYPPPNGDFNAYYQRYQPNYHNYENSRQPEYSPQIQNSGESRRYNSDKEGYAVNDYDGRRDGYGGQQSERNVYSVDQPRRVVPIQGVNSKEPQVFHPAKREDKETETKN